VTEPAQAEQIIATNQADAILMAREFLRQPYWPLHAAKALNVDIPWPFPVFARQTQVIFSKTIFDPKAQVSGSLVKASGNKKSLSR